MHLLLLRLLKVSSVVSKMHMTLAVLLWSVKSVQPGMPSLAVIFAPTTMLASDQVKPLSVEERIRISWSSALFSAA